MKKITGIVMVIGTTRHVMSREQALDGESCSLAEDIIALDEKHEEVKSIALGNAVVEIVRE